MFFDMCINLKKNGNLSFFFFIFVKNKVYGC